MPDDPPAPGSLPPRVSRGEVCAWCLAEFVEAHGKPVYCPKCYDNAFATRKSFSLLPKAWIELDVKRHR
jgi:hypothetical protein